MNQQTVSKIAIVGAGAVGSLLGGLLARAGNDVTLIGRPGHVEAINTNGLYIDGILGEFTIPIHAAETLKFRPDLVLLTVKMPDLETTCQQIAPYVMDVPILTLQNGVKSDAIAANAFGKQNIVGGIVLFNARFLKPGYVTYGSKGALLIGEAFRKNGRRVRDISDLLNQITHTTVCDNIQGARWTKLLINVLGNSLEAMTGESLRTCMKARGTRRIGTLILKEALEVIEKARIRLASLPDIPITAFKLTIKSPLPVASLVLQFITSATDTVTSTLQSLRRGRPTEIDYLNGEIVRLGRGMNVATPYNSKAVDLIREVEKTHQFYSPSRVESMFFNKEGG
jgi:2-dehydropantoate 2-reductase